MIFYIIHRHGVFLVDCVDLICSLYSWWEGFGSSSLATLWLGFNSGLRPPLHVSYPLGFAPEASLEDLVCPCEGRCGSGRAAWVSGVLAAAGTQESWQLG